jgi:hypothetical protein
MATTTNYAWTTPDNSGLVKNGAQDIRTLGSSVDTALWNSGYGQAGKNKIINGDFNINQRAFTSTTSNTTYTVDRWQTIADGGTSTYSVETFTPGTAPVAGYEGKNFIRIVTTGQSGATDSTRLQQFIESVRTFAGQTVTVSFWAKAGSGTPSVACYFEQMFGSGGSPSSTVILNGQKTAITTSWARYSFTFSIPSISGKTLGTTNDGSLRFLILTSAGSNFNARTDSLGIQSATIDIWGFQVEAGSIATPFQTATGTIQGELAACQRYYYRTTASGAYSIFGLGYGKTTNTGNFVIPFPVTMRAQATALDYSTLVAFDGVNLPAITAAALQYSNPNSGVIDFTVAAGTLTQFRPYSISSNNSTSGYIGFSAEL